jgi:hypothetical protein
MATLIGTVVLLTLLYYAYRAGRRWLLPRPRSREPLRDRLDDPTPRGGLVWAETAGEARECELSRQLISGHIDSAAYRREMGELARLDRARSGDPR